MPADPKPPERRQRRRPAGQNARNVKLAVLPPAGAVPACPEGFLEASRESWEAFWRSDLSRLVNTETDLAALTRLFSLRDDRERAHQTVQDSPVTKGSMGQQRLSPLWDLISKLDAQILQLEDRFGLTPKGRLKVGAQFGETARSLEELNRRYADPDKEAADKKAEDPRLSALPAQVEQPPSGK